MPLFYFSISLTFSLFPSSPVIDVSTYFGFRLRCARGVPFSFRSSFPPYRYLRSGFSISTSHGISSSLISGSSSPSPNRTFASAGGAHFHFSMSPCPFFSPALMWRKVPSSKWMYLRTQSDSHRPNRRIPSISIPPEANSVAPPDLTE